jgi:hypothetical protein
MCAAVEFTLANDRSEDDRKAQLDHILSLLKIGDDHASRSLYREATFAYYSIFEPNMCDQTSFGLLRVAPLELYARAVSRLRVVANQYAEKLVDCGCFLAGESHDGIVGVPRGALNLYLISNQYDVFTQRALQYAEEEQAKRDIKRFLMSSVRVRLSHLRAVAACAPLLSEEKDAFAVLAGFEASLHACLASRRQVPHRCAETMCT